MELLQEGSMHAMLMRAASAHREYTMLGSRSAQS